MADQDPKKQSKRRVASVYDAVAGRVGLNGFLTPEQLQSSSVIPYAAHEVLQRSINAPDQDFESLYSADGRLKPTQKLPDSDLVKAAHSYASDFYNMAIENRGQHDFRSLDETALLAFGILLEEASREMLGVTGDMALIEPEGLEHGLPESKITKYQVQGRVNPRPTPETGSDASDEYAKRPKRPRVTNNSTSV